MPVGRVRLLVCAVLASLLTVTMLVASRPARAAGPGNCDGFTDGLLQVVNPRSGASLATRSESEASGAARYGFTEDRGVLAEVARSPEAGLTAVYRLYKAGDFVWAAQGTEAAAFVAQGYSQQFIEFYAATNPVPCLTAVERLERNGMHRLAIGPDAAALVRDGWQRGATAFYAMNQAGPGSSPTPTPSSTPEPSASSRPTTSTPTTSPTPPPAGGDTKFSIAVIPDTQNEVLSAADTRMRNRATWLADNKASLDLRYALQIGDVVNWGHVAPAQFTKASEEVRPLEAAMPWATAVGNHDTAAVCAGGSACPGANTSVTLRDTSAFNRTFPVSRFDDVRGTFEANKIDNAYATFSAGGVDWMVLTLELWPRTSVVTWARDIVRAHPDHNVIVVTHAYLEANGSISTSNGGYGANSPQYVYDNLIKVFPNIKLVLSGHTGQAGSRTDIGADGNKVLSLLQTYHSPNTNPVRLVDIGTATGTVTSRVFAPLTRTDYPGDATTTTGLRFR